MEFSEKLQTLRKQHSLTQEELAQALYVSRTAVSKWESGRGVPNIESLKAISRYFSVSIDELLSGEELIMIVDEDGKKRQERMRDLVFGLADCGALALLFLPLFGQHGEEVVRMVALPALTGIAPYIMSVYYALAAALTAAGILTLALQNCECVFWTRHKYTLSLALGMAATLCFIASRQPYAAVFMLIFMTIECTLLIKSR